MIFVTVGEQLPFDRLITAIDTNAAKMEQEIFAQIGHKSITPQHITCKDFITPKEYNEYFLQADLIIAHAGMGTIISAMEHNKPIIVMPRRCSFGEHRNDHQFSTAKRFGELGYITVAQDEQELVCYLQDIDTFIGSWKSREKTNVSPQLLEAVRAFIFTK